MDSGIERIKEQLKSLGFDTERTSYGLKFTYRDFMFTVMDENDLWFININLICELPDEKQDADLDVLEALNTLNNRMKVIKAVAREHCLWLMFEMFLTYGVKFEDFIFRALDSLIGARENFIGILYKED